ncbi:thiamine pyrophosphate-dependent enzyme [Streptomyces sp. AM6-12]|uniref:thiamine pyrophosphate-dependent enzyme n=1 Tax=Streptomyces sp. AM6-12 TaxID=3345149 RepID=UPI00378B48F3
MAEVVAARLRGAGVDRVYGVPCLALDPLVRELANPRSARAVAPWFVQARGEESAALMACAHAKLTCRLGCCLAPPGAGALRLLAGLYDAAADRAPVLVLAGGDDGGLAVRHLAEVSVFCEPVSRPAQLPDALHRAVRAALTERGVASVVVGREVLTATAPGEPADDDSPRPAPVRPPDESLLRRAAAVLDAARRPAVLVGNAGRAASAQAAGVAALLGAGAAVTALARDALPDDLPYQTGVAGPLGSTAAATLLQECDTLLLVGAEDLDPAVLPDRARCRIVAVEPAEPPRAVAVAASGDVSSAAEVRVRCDPPAFLEALIPLLRRNTDRAWRTHVEDTVRGWRAEGRTRAGRYFGTSVNPRAVVAELSERLPDRAVVVTDSGTALDWWTRHLRLRNGMRSLLSGRLGLPGAAVPYAVAAKFAAPERPVIALVGDGAFQSGGLNELITVRRHSGLLGELPPLVFCVLNNGDLNRLTWQRRAAAGDPLIPLSAEVPAMPYAEWARLAGVPAVRCDRPRHVASVWADVLTRPGPVLLEFVVDGETPPDWATADASAAVV